jgi:hypothetical protein
VVKGDRAQRRHRLRLARAISQAIQLGILTAQEVAVIAEVAEKRKRREEIAADLSEKEGWLDERFGRDSWDPKAEAPNALAWAVGDVGNDFARLPREPSTAENPLESPATSQAGRPYPKDAKATAPSSPTSMTEMSPAHPCAPAAPDSPGKRISRPTSGSERRSESRRNSHWQPKRIKWAVERLYPGGCPGGINVKFLTKKIADELASAEAKKVGMSDKGAPCWKSVKRFLNPSDAKETAAPNPANA